MQVLTGGVDRKGVLFDRESGSVVTSLVGHSRRVSRVLFHGREDLLVTGSHDQTVKLWTPASGAGYAATSTIRAHSGEVTGLSLHPIGDYLGSSAADGTWAFTDVHTARTLAVQQSPVPNQGKPNKPHRRKCVEKKRKEKKKRGSK